MRIALLFSAAVAIALPARGQAPDFAQLAHRIITTTVAVQPGEVVVISGGKHTIPFMEALAIEAQMAGAMPTIFLNSDSVSRSFNLNVPEKYLSQEPRFYAEWMKQVDVFISLPNASDIKALDVGVSDARYAKMGRAYDFMIPMWDKMKFRELDITWPTNERGTSFNLDGPTYVNMIWGAMNVDYAKMAARADALRKRLHGAKAVHVTSAAGTDITFAIGDRPIVIDAGVMTKAEAKGKKVVDRTISLPSGTLAVAPIESSANGKIVVPRVGCRFEVMKDVSFTVKNGHMQGVKAGSGLACYDAGLAGSSGATQVIGSFSIGVNPSWPAHEEGGAAYYPGDGAGFVTIGFGDNQLMGGKNKTTGGYGYPFPIVDATVWIDGIKVVDGGKFVE